MRRVFELAEALFQSIRMQLSVGRYQAIAVGRGANLDSIDAPLNNRPWLKAQFQEIRKLPAEAPRLVRLDEIVNWTNPGPGGFYDDLGNPACQPHLVRPGHYVTDPEFRAAPLVHFEERPAARKAWLDQALALFDAPLKLLYFGLDPAAQYKVKVVYGGGPIRLVANAGHEIHGPLTKTYQPVEFDIPRPRLRAAPGADLDALAGRRRRRPRLPGGGGVVDARPLMRVLTDPCRLVLTRTDCRPDHSSLVAEHLMTLEEYLCLAPAIAIVALVAVAVVRLRRWRANTLAAVLGAFFGTDPHRLPIVSRRFVTVDLPNLHLALTGYARTTGSPVILIGYVAGGYGDHDLRSLVGHETNFAGVHVGPVQYREVDIDVDQRRQCMVDGLHLFGGPHGKVAAHVQLNRISSALELEVMAASPEIGSEFIEEIRRLASEDSVYRRKIISLECDAESWGRRGCGNVRFHQFAPIDRDDIILPDGTMKIIERNTVGFFQHADALRRSGRSVKRGLLLHGKPGTGKSYTAKWLARSLDGVTVLLLSGEQLWLIKECCQMARMLAPALVIMEDVDLIASQRDESRHPFYQITLHQLLNEMDGLASEAEVLFLLTTNRPDVIEPALAMRPGRIDQAIEFPLPDADCRRRLLHLYSRGLTLAVRDMDQLSARIEGASPTFIQELMRKAALIAAEENSLDEGRLRVTDSHCEAALRELVLGGGELTRNLLGFAANATPR